MLAILRGANGRRHEVDFKGEPLFVTTAQSERFQWRGRNSSAARRSMMRVAVAHRTRSRRIAETMGTARAGRKSPSTMS